VAIARARSLGAALLILDWIIVVIAPSVSRPEEVGTETTTRRAGAVIAVTLRQTRRERKGFTEETKITKQKFLRPRCAFHFPLRAFVVNFPPHRYAA
jgi:hypothetical protein